MCVKQTYYDIYMHVSTHTQAQRQEERGSSMCTKISFKNMKILLSALHSAALEKASPSDPAYHPHASSPFLGVHRGLSCVPRPTLFTPDTTLWLSEFSYVSTSSLFFFFFLYQKNYMNGHFCPLLQDILWFPYHNGYLCFWGHSVLGSF